MTEPSDDKMLCYCRNVRYGTVRRSIDEVRATKIEEVMAACDAGTGCRSCHPDIQILLDQARAKRGGVIGFFKRLFGR